MALRTTDYEDRAMWVQLPQSSRKKISQLRKREKNMLTKKDFVKVIAEQQNTTQKNAEAIINAFVNGVKAVFAKNETLMLSGFAKFESKLQPATLHHLNFDPEHPRTIEVPEKFKHSIKASKTL